MKIYYITRTYPGSNSGGGIIRQGTVNNLRKLGYDVWIVAPDFLSKEVTTDVDKKHILIPFKGNLRIFLGLEYCGMVKDYLANWAKDAFDYLKYKIKTEDLLFVTSGGEMGTLILGSLLKNNLGCKLITNLHDPIDHTKIDGRFTYDSNYFHVSRNKIEIEYFSDNDAIVTSSISYKDALQKKYPEISDKIYCNHFGYIKPIDKLAVRQKKGPLNIVYGGTFGALQSPEILAEAVLHIDNVKATFIGHFEINKKLMTYKDFDKVMLVPAMTQEEYIQYLLNHADVGFLSLQGNISNYCVPSKMYEYINIGIPILASVNGDAKKIIEDNNYGFVSKYDTYELISSIEKLQDSNSYNQCIKRVTEDREFWSMENKIKELDEIIKKITFN